MKKRNKSDEEIVLIRSGDYSMLASFKKGEEVLLGDPSTFVYAGVTMEEEQRQIEETIDDIIYSKPVALVKKLKRRIKKK